MRLSGICEGHWAAADINYPNQLNKPKKRKKPLSFMTNPEETPAYMKHMGLSEDSLDSALDNSVNVPINNRKKYETDSINNKKELDLKKKLNTQIVQPKIRQLKTTIRDMTKKLDDEQKQDNEAVNQIKDNIKSVKRNMDDILRYSR